MSRGGDRIENIRIARQEKNLTIEKLVELAGISDSFLGVVERGTSGASIETLISIAKALDVTTDSLILQKMMPSQSIANKREKLMTLLQNSGDSELDFFILRYS